MGVHPGHGPTTVEACVEPRIWCTNDAEPLQPTIADDLPDLTSFAGSLGDMIEETEDNTDEEVGFDMGVHSSGSLSHHSIEAADSGALRLEEWDFNAEDDGSDDETW